MTPVLLLLTSELLPLFLEEWIQGNYAYIFKVTEKAFSFLDAEMQLRLKLHVIELETIHSSIFLLWTTFF